MQQVEVHQELCGIVKYYFGGQGKNLRWLGTRNLVRERLSHTQEESGAVQDLRVVVGSVADQDPTHCGLHKHHHLGKFNFMSDYFTCVTCANIYRV